MRYLKLTDKKNNGQLVFLDEEENEYNVIEIKNKEYKLKYISLVPYFLEDTELYDEYVELTEEEYFLELARQLAKEYHKGQVDKAGVDYFSGHITSVVNGVDTVEEKIVAYLHDILEDTELSYLDLMVLEFSDKVINAVMFLTKDKKEKYEDYLVKVKSNELSRAVKLSDLTNNMDLSRLKEITEVDKKRLEKYKKAYKYLKEQD
jgi:hypothetical protein